MKKYSCPDCHINTNSCDGCPRINSQFVDWSKLNIKSYDNIPDSCRYCATHPSNGGDGICWCVSGSYHITC